MLRSLLPNGMSKTCAISRSCPSIWLMPSSTFVYITGNTMRKEISTDRFREETQIRTRMTKDATGMDLMVTTKGRRSSLSRTDAAESPARATPRTTASINPPTIRSMEEAMESQNSPVTASSKRVETTVTGDTRSISCPMHMLTACQMSSQTRTAHSLILFLGVVEIFIWQLSSYSFRVLLI